MNKRTCSMPECTGTVHARGWCNKHYTRWKKHGDPERVITYRDTDECLAARTIRDGYCLVWTGLKNQFGYGRVRHNGRFVMVHRYVWEREHGPIPDGKFIDHMCWNRACVNVSHMRTATRTENRRYANGAHVTNKLGVRGVTQERNGTYRARVRRFDETHTAWFRDLDEAAEWADNKRRELFGEFAGR